MIFANSSLNSLIKGQLTPSCARVIINGESKVLVCLSGDPVYTPLPLMRKEFTNGGKSLEEQFFGYCLSSPRMVTEYAFGRLEARFGCLRRDMDITNDDLPYVIHSCFTLNNFCETNSEAINPVYIGRAKKYDQEFQPPLQIGYSVFAKYFYQ